MVGFLQTLPSSYTLGEKQQAATSIRGPYRPMTRDELDNLIRPDAVELRDATDVAQLQSLSSQNVEALEGAISHEMRLLTLDSRRAADIFWKIAEEERDSGKEHGRLGTQVRLHHENHQATWFTNSFTHKNKISGEKKFCATHLPKSTGRNSHKYPQSTFNASPDWERDIATVVEGRYSTNRKKAQLLMQMRRLLKQYKKIQHEE